MFELISYTIAICIVLAILRVRTANSQNATSNVLPDKAKTDSSQGKFRDKPTLLNRAEQDLYGRLITALPDMLIFPQVSMSQIFHIDGRTTEGKIQLARIGRKSLDFVICRNTDTSIVAAIELNGPHHEKEFQRRADNVKRAALETAGIPLIVLYPNDLPSIQCLQLIVRTRITIREHFEAKRDKHLAGR